MKPLLTILLLTSAAFGGIVTTDTITGPFTEVAWNGGFAATNLPTATLTNSTNSGYTLTATACFDGWCPGQSGSGTYTVNDPITLRATGVTLSCNQTGGCNTAETINFFMNFTAVSPGAGTTLPVTFSVDGMAPANYSFSVNANFLTVSSGSQTVMANSLGAFSQSFNLGNIKLLSGNNNKASLSFTVSSLGNGQSITFPNSQTITLGGVPEPATLALLLVGLGGLGWLARKRQA